MPGLEGRVGGWVDLGPCGVFWPLFGHALAGMAVGGGGGWGSTFIEAGGGGRDRGFQRENLERS